MVVLPKADLGEENLEALKKGIVNLEKHIENLQKFGVPVVVTLNSFVTDTEGRDRIISSSSADERDCEFALAKVWENGGEGGSGTCRKSIKDFRNKERVTLSHYMQMICHWRKDRERLQKKSMGLTACTYAPAAAKELKRIADMGIDRFPGMYGERHSIPCLTTRAKLGRPSWIYH